MVEPRGIAQAGMRMGRQPPSSKKRRISRSAAEAIRQPRDRLKRQPQERQHSAVNRSPGWRDAEPTASGEGCRIQRKGSKPEGRRQAKRRLRSREPDRRSRMRQGRRSAVEWSSTDDRGSSARDHLRQFRCDKPVSRRSGPPRNELIINRFSRRYKSSKKQAAV